MNVLKKFLIVLAVLMVMLMILLAVAANSMNITFDRAFFNSLLGMQTESPEQIQKGVSVPPGFRVTLFARGLRNPRFMAVSAAGDILVSSPRSNQVLLLAQDANRDGKADAVISVLENLNKPHGLAFHGGYLYVAETDAIGRVRFNPGTRQVEGDYEQIVTGLPSGGNHWTKTIAFGPDGLLYLSIGSSCNVCEEKEPLRAAMLRMNPDGNDMRMVAAGLRNSVGFDWSPVDGALYATDNGRDLLGNDFPPCELNKVEQGGFYGWPYRNGFNVPDPDFGGQGGELEQASIEPVHGFRAHNAPLGMSFIDHPSWPEAYQQQALVALHGSWNRSVKDGYEVVSLHWQADGSIEERPFMTGFLHEQKVLGRPVDVVQAQDGAVYISDDFAGAVYRVTYTGEPSAQSGASPSALEVGDLDSSELVASEIQTSEIIASAPLDLSDAQAKRAQQGKQLIASQDCLTCHQIAGFEQGGGVALKQLYQRYDAATLTDFFLAPTPPMPAVALPERERSAMALYLLSRP